MFGFRVIVMLGTLLLHVLPLVLKFYTLYVQLMTQLDSGCVGFFLRFSPVSFCRDMSVGLTDMLKSS